MAFAICLRPKLQEVTLATILENEIYIPFTNENKFTVFLKRAFKCMVCIFTIMNECPFVNFLYFSEPGRNYIFSLWTSSTDMKALLGPSAQSPVPGTSTRKLEVPLASRAGGVWWGAGGCGVLAWRVPGRLQCADIPRAISCAWTPHALYSRHPTCFP